MATSGTRECSHVSVITKMQQSSMNLFVDIIKLRWSSLLVIALALVRKTLAEGKGSKPRKVAQFRQNSVVPGPSRCRDCKATISRASSNSGTPSPRSRKIKSEGDKEDITVLVPVGCGEKSTHTSWPSEKKKRRKRSAPTEGPVAASRSSAKRGREEEPLRQSRKRTGDAPQDLAPHPMETQARKRKREEECLESFASRYTLGDLLGTGGCGAVYAGVRDADGKQIAIKFVPKSDKEEFITVVSPISLLT
ncbi:uncharacterized protein LOC143474581 [Brachyhypopomus gauderio]|uniref:uncharacterized protein LOC143474581 n=1 Tax=Brachyhypopomus gauderio TaxID=698409 RepID=UPI0040427229